MKRIHKLFAENNVFFIIFFACYFFLSFLVFAFPKQESFQFINSKHSIFFDYFFTVITQFGDGLLIIIFSILCFFLWSRRLGLSILITYVGSGLLCSLLKRIFQAPRPGFLLEHDPSFHSLDWLPMSYHNAFPSGHTCSSFAFAASIALFGKNKTIGIISLLIAFLTGYSRVYLGQHYLEDIWFGCLIGILFTCFYSLTLSYFSENKFSLLQLPPNFRL